MFRRVQALRHERNAPEVAQADVDQQEMTRPAANGAEVFQTFDNTLPSASKVAQTDDAFPAVGDPHEVTRPAANGAEAFQPIDNTPAPASEVALMDDVFPPVGDPHEVIQPAANGAEAFQNIDIVDIPLATPPGRSITCEFLPGMFRPLRTDGPWIVWNYTELPHEQDLDDELLLPLDDEFDWGDVATTCSSLAPITGDGDSHS
eukprot:TRINITY_DN3984_c0_g1_i1.p1 TRINITY_DN3984_c0_g1~~TRINITY_DN3984_c0_g1_i1.p1  ORF type:complete len:204 (-),score=38.14 TRINITY_DN3984_c0_g1_i1:148-759(-)